MAFNKKFFTTGGIVASSPEPVTIDPLQNFETVTYTGNGSTQKITGYIRKGAAFNGSSSYIGIGDELIPATSNFSLSFWIYRNNTLETDLFNQATLSGDIRTYFKLYSNGTLGVSSAGGNGSRIQVPATSSTVTNGQWEHIAIVRDGSNMTFYINGTGETETISGGTVGVGRGDLFIISNSALDGKLDQVRIFNRVLDETNDGEVTTLYNETYASSTKSTTDIFGDGSGIALYELDGDANDTGSNADTVDTADIFEDNSIIDFYKFDGNTQSANNAPFYSLQTTSTTYGDGILGQSLYLNGSQTASLTANTYGTMNLTGSYSLSLYFNATTASKRNIIWYLEQINGYSSGIEFGSDNKLYFGGAAITSQTYSANTWYNIVISFDASNGLIKAYVDGQLLGSRTGNTATGSTQCFGHGAVGLTGYIDQVRFFNEVIDDSEAAELYEARVKYDGTPTNVNFLGMAFQPDFVWVKNRTSNWGHTLVDSVRGLNAASVYGALSSDQTASETTNNVFGAIKSLDTNGFTTEGGSDVNGYYAVGRLNNDYVAWCWKAGGSSNTYNVDDTGYSTASDAGLSSANVTTLNGASVNTQAGFSIINYETNVNGDNRPAHGLTQEPELIIFKPYDTSSLNWYVMTKKIDGSLDFLFLNTTDTKIDAGTNEFIDSTHFRTSFGTVWGSIIAYCFHSVDGYQRVGTYLGSGVSGKRVYTTDDGTPTGNGGFRPRFVMYKLSSSSGHSWVMIDDVRSPSNPRNKYLFADSSGQEGTTNVLNFIDNGFELLLTDLGTNALNETYIYLAIA
jgi:hypothetical protein